MSMYLLLRLHSPRPAQAPQYWLKSSQRSQRPHAMGQCGSIQAGLLEHSDSEAQLAQYLHTVQKSGMGMIKRRRIQLKRRAFS